MNATVNTFANSEDDFYVIGFWVCITLFGIVSNIIIMLGILRNKKMRKSTSYWLILSLSLCDVGMLLVSVGILLPSTALHDSWVETDSFHNALAIFVYDSFWYTGVLHMALMALNRYVNICRSRYYTRLFSKRRTRYEILVLYVLGVAISLPGLFPCCLLVYNHWNYAAIYLPPETPYQYVDVAIDGLGALIMVGCYARIVTKVRRTRVALTTYRKMIRESARAKFQSSQYQKPHGGRISIFLSCLPSPHPIISRRELRLFFQFFALSLIFLCTFVTWQIMSYLPVEMISKWNGFVATTLFFVNNCTNPSIYLIFNITLRKEVCEMLCIFTRTEQRIMTLPDQTKFLLAQAVPYSFAGELSAMHAGAAAKEEEPSGGHSSTGATTSQRESSALPHVTDMLFGRLETRRDAMCAGRASQTDNGEILL